MKTLKDTALTILARRDHSTGELKTKLKRKFSFSDEEFRTLVTSLKEWGYLVDEKELAQRWVRHWQKEGRGHLWISAKLKAKRLPPVSISDQEELEAARLFIEKRLKTQSPKTLTRNEKAKLARSLNSRGFSHSVVATLLL